MEIYKNIQRIGKFISLQITNMYKGPTMCQPICNECVMNLIPQNGNKSRTYKELKYQNKNCKKQRLDQV